MTLVDLGGNRTEIPLSSSVMLYQLNYEAFGSKVVGSKGIHIQVS